MATLRLFASIREAAGTGSTTIEADTVGELIEAAAQQFGAEFARVLPSCRVWVNGEQALHVDAISADDEVALLPPVSGG